MTKVRVTTYLLIICGLFLVNCGSSDEQKLQEELKKATDDLVAKSEVASAEAVKAETVEKEEKKEFKIELEEKIVEQMGVKIKIPKGSKALAEDKISTTYSLPFPNGLHEINVSIAAIGAKSLERAKKDATMMGGTVAEGKALEKGKFEITLAPMGTFMQTVHVFLADNSVKCAGPPDQLTVLKEICASLAKK